MTGSALYDTRFAFFKTRHLCISFLSHVWRFPARVSIHLSSLSIAELLPGKAAGPVAWLRPCQSFLSGVRAGDSLSGYTKHWLWPCLSQQLCKIHQFCNEPIVVMQGGPDAIPVRLQNAVTRIMNRCLPKLKSTYLPMPVLNGSMQVWSHSGLQTDQLTDQLTDI